ncbi:MAG: hypothetical protein M0D55_18380 [Elusimicrobiota bacterium]|nr:MAG: hypothetical protein M0D55_18380 [Elusimicrobiota bacterium]
MPSAGDLADGAALAGRDVDAHLARARVGRDGRFRARVAARAEFESDRFLDLVEKVRRQRAADDLAALAEIVDALEAAADERGHVRRRARVDDERVAVGGEGREVPAALLKEGGHELAGLRQGHLLPAVGAGIPADKTLLGFGQLRVRPLEPQARAHVLRRGGGGEQQQDGRGAEHGIMLARTRFAGHLAAVNDK